MPIKNIGHYSEIRQSAQLISDQYYAALLRHGNKQCETEKICMANKRCLILVQQKKVQSFEIYNLSRNVVHNTENPFNNEA